MSIDGQNHIHRTYQILCERDRVPVLSEPNIHITQSHCPADSAETLNQPSAISIRTGVINGNEPLGKREQNPPKAIQRHVC